MASGTAPAIESAPQRRLVRRPLDLQSLREEAVAAPDPLETGKVTSLSESEDVLRFELSGVEPGFANELRRTLMQDVPALAIDVVEIQANASSVLDEVISQRLGLVPIRSDPAMYGADEDVVFTLRAFCPPTPVGERARNCRVLAGELRWRPKEGQAPAAVAHPGIVIVELAPGQELSCTCHARKGTGKVHAKFSPVSTASYRYVPQITFKRPVEGELARQLVTKCPSGVFTAEKGRAVVANPLACGDCRQCAKPDESVAKGFDWDDYVTLGRAPRRFEFTIESVGRPVRALYAEAMQIVIARRRQQPAVPAGQAAEEEEGLEEEVEELEVVEKK